MKTKNTHTVQDIEKWMYDLTVKIQNAETKTEKQALLKKLKGLEAHYNACKEKEINGKKYPVKKKPVEISKKELLELIDSVEIDQTVPNHYYVKPSDLDVTGVSVGSNRFTFIE